MLGLAYAQTDRAYIRTTLHTIQGRLFSLGAELASDEEGLEKLKGILSEEDVAFLEQVVDTCTETTGKQTHFVIPGVDPCSAAPLCGGPSGTLYPCPRSIRCARWCCAT